MLRAELIDELRIIAFCEKAAAGNRVAACETLYKQGHDASRVIQTLEEIATVSMTPDSVKVRALQVLHKIDMEMGKTPTMDSVDEQNLTDALMEQYVNGRVA